MKLTTATFFNNIDAEPSSVYVMHERSELHLPPHEHKKGQLSYVEGGVAHIHTKVRSLIIPARHYIWIPAGLTHFIEMRRSVIIRTLYFYNHDDGDDPFYSKPGIYPINALLLNMLTYSERWDGNVMPGDKAFHFLAGIKNILPEISKKALPIALPVTENERMLPVLRYINKNIFEDLTLDGVSHENGFSPRTLSRLFQSTLKVSFLQYVKLVRIIKAIEMMLQTNKSISEIAYSLGYNSVSAFSHVFHQLTETRPSEFAKQVVNL